MKQERYLFLLFAIIFFGGFQLIYKIAFNSWDQEVYFYSSDQARTPAAIRKKFDFSHLEGSQLMTHSQERLLASAKILMNQESVGIELGHFVAKNDLGKKDFACNAFNQIELVFKAGDMLVHGAPPEMIIEGPCKTGLDKNRISALWIPMAEIIKKKTGNISVEPTDQNEISIRFSNVGDEWPRIWGLASVRLSSSIKSSAEIFIDETRINEILDKPLTFFWTQDYDEPKSDSL